LSKKKKKKKYKKIFDNWNGLYSYYDSYYASQASTSYDISLIALDVFGGLSVNAKDLKD